MFNIGPQHVEPKGRRKWRERRAMIWISAREEGGEELEERKGGGGGEEEGSGGEKERVRVAALVFQETSDELPP